MSEIIAFIISLLVSFNSIGAELRAEINATPTAIPSVIIVNEPVVKRGVSFISEVVAGTHTPEPAPTTISSPTPTASPSSYPVVIF